jgi:putative transposase
MLRAYKYRIYPTKQQRELINKHIGACRFVYNLALETKQMAYIGNRVNLSYFDLTKQLPDLKKECPWLKEINSQSLQVSIGHLDEAFNRFFKKQGKFPKFKKKSSKGSFNVPQYVRVDFEENKLHIGKFGKRGINIILDRTFNGIIRQATISKTPTDKYFASILVDTREKVPDKLKIKEETTIGIDLGINSFLVSSDGLRFDNPRFLRQSISRLKFTQRKYSKHKGKKTKYRLALLHEKVTNQRKDFLHKVSTQLVKSHDNIAIEDLSINNMLKNHYLAQSISDVGWGLFVSMLKYKAEWYGKNILKIGRFEPSSKTCSVCGKINENLSLKDREWACENCGSTLDRDINAAINIKNFALKKLISVEHRLENQDELPTLVGVMTPEAHLE